MKLIIPLSVFVLCFLGYIEGYAVLREGNSAELQLDTEVPVVMIPQQKNTSFKILKKENIWFFNMVGQSNMARRGRLAQEFMVTSSRIWTIHKNGKPIFSNEPLHFYEPKMAGLDCCLSYDEKLLQHVSDSISILLIPTSVGGSSISQWRKDTVHRNVPLFVKF